jgi:hypothetical protein
MWRKLSVLIFVGLLFLAVGCGGETAVEPGDVATAVPELIETAVPEIETMVPETVDPAAVTAAVETVSAQLAVAADQVEVVSFQEMEWPDGCLGLANPDEGCTMAIVPGWQIIVSVAGTTYEVRTNDTGSMVRWQVQGS